MYGDVGCSCLRQPLGAGESALLCRHTLLDDDCLHVILVASTLLQVTHASVCVPPYYRLVAKVLKRTYTARLVGVNSYSVLGNKNELI